MSICVDCPSCAMGDHERHDPDHGIIPGLIGGTRCDCPGDCAERSRAAAEDFVAKWLPQLAPATTPTPPEPLPGERGGV